VLVIEVIPMTEGESLPRLVTGVTAVTSFRDTSKPVSYRKVLSFSLPSRTRFKGLLKRADLPQVRFHDLRHTYATVLLTKNVNPKIVSEMLGHATIAITLDTYSHVLPNMGEAAATAMDDALS
jgi:integrase